MDHEARRKVLAGGRVRKLRTELGLSQSAMAAEIGISASYLNLVERNERPLTAQLLIKLSETYAIDPSAFAQEEEQRSVTALEEVFADPLFQSAPVPRSEIRSMAESAPGMAEAVKRIYRAYVEVREFESGNIPTGDRDEPTAGDPVEATRAFLEQNNNYFQALDEKAERIAGEMSGALFPAISERLASRHNVRVEVTPIEAMRQVLRHYDRHRRKLMISELFGGSGRAFHAAFHLGLVEANEELDVLSAKLGPEASPVRKLGRIMLANYFAAALIMPYQKFAEAADALAYDLDILGARFSASFEQVAHRLTTLARPSQRKVPFFLIRVDNAGNVSKRFSSGAFPFARFGGTCARWNIHGAFRTPGRIERQIVEMPDRSRWFTIARTVERRAVPWGDAEAQFVVGLGCELKHAHRLVYSRGLDLKAPEPTPIGINCRLCERPDCAQRAAPPLMRKFDTSETTRGQSPFLVGAA
jgi:XRE family transcriptional regulator, fatty acid utilization regulator